MKMKPMFKKNQMLITALAVMIAVAGYLNFSGRDLSVVKENSMEESPIQNEEEGAEAMAGESISEPVKDRIEASEELSTDVPIGEAVLTSANISNYIASTKMEREQTYAKAKENLQSIIDDMNVSNTQREEAIAKKASISDNMEKEAATEQLLGSRGFLNSIVTIQNGTVDVCVQAQELSSVEKAQIEEIVTRTADCKVSDLVISTLQIQEEAGQ